MDIFICLSQLKLVDPQQNFDRTQPNASIDTQMIDSWYELINGVCVRLQRLVDRLV